MYYDAPVSSTKPTIKVDPVSPVLLREQVAAAIRSGRRGRRDHSGQRMPPARDVAAVLGVDTTAGAGRRQLGTGRLVRYRGWV